jgi:hypothetical protein
MRAGLTMLLVSATACADVLNLGALTEGDASTTGDGSADGGDEAASNCSPTLGSASDFVKAGGQGTGIAVDDTNVYWVDTQSGRVLYCPKSGCSTPLVVAASLVKPIAVAAASGKVFWTALGNADNMGSVYFCSTSTLPSCSFTSIAGENHPIAIAVNANKVVWANEGSAVGDAGVIGSLEDGLIRAASLDLKGPQTLASGQHNPNGIAIDANDNVYWINTDDGTVMAYSLSTPGQTTLTTTNEFPINIATDGKMIYWPTALSNIVYGCDPAKCSPTVISSSQDGPIGIAADCSGVYFSTDSKVATCPLTGCSTPASPTLVGNGDHPSSVALDSTNVFWVDYNGGTVGHAPKQ